MRDYIFGKRNVSELVGKLKKEGKSPRTWPFREIIVKKNPSKDILDILKTIPSEIKITHVSGGDLDAELPGKNHQGIALLREKNLTREKYKSLDDLLENLSIEKSLVLVLDRIQDIGNFGGILRTAECFGVKHILIPERESAGINETVEKIASGALHYLNVYRVTNLNASLEKLKEIGYWTVATDETGTENWEKLPPKEEIVLVMGNEGKGVKRLLQENSDFMVRIPMHGSISSLNVTVATGIALDRIVNR
jgi:23S rRNA (guanosine2251-2'-O)-methyltransferase